MKTIEFNNEMTVDEKLDAKMLELESWIALDKAGKEIPNTTISDPFVMLSTKIDKLKSKEKKQMTALTKEELTAKVAQLEEKLEVEKAKGANMKTRVKDLLDSGVNTIDQLASELAVTNKNISSVLTSIRKELIEEGKTIITQKHNNKTMIAVLDLSTLGW